MFYIRPLILGSSDEKIEIKTDKSGEVYLVNINTKISLTVDEAIVMVNHLQSRIEQIKSVEAILR
jgi:hypothetical protein